MRPERRSDSALQIYPTLTTEGEGHAYRLQQITRIQAEVMREAEKRASLSKKCKRALNFVDGADAALMTVGTGLGIGGVFLREKINTISDIVSKALADGNISYVEYRLGLDELQKFKDMKRDVNNI